MERPDAKTRSKCGSNHAGGNTHASPHKQQLLASGSPGTPGSVISDSLPGIDCPEAIDARTGGRDIDERYVDAGAVPSAPTATNQ